MLAVAFLVVQRRLVDHGHPLLANLGCTMFAVVCWVAVDWVTGGDDAVSGSVVVAVDDMTVVQAYWNESAQR